MFAEAETAGAMTWELAGASEAGEPTLAYLGPVEVRPRTAESGVAFAVSGSELRQARVSISVGGQRTTTEGPVPVPQ